MNLRRGDDRLHGVAADPSATMDQAPSAADATSDDASEPPKRTARRTAPEVVNVPGYEILGILGRGGMGKSSTRRSISSSNGRSP